MTDYAELNQCLYDGKAKEVDRLVREFLAAGRPVDEVLNEGLIAAMAVVGEDFKYNILYVPEVLIAARAMKAGMAVLKPLLTADATKYPPRGTVVMGTVKGDLHDIGKNLVCMMAEGAGFRIVDIGVDQPVERFIEACREHNAQIVGMSALLTTTMPYMKTVIDRFEGIAELAGVKIAIGGAPVSQVFSEEIGADGYGADASSSVEMFLRFISDGSASPSHARVA
jgi:5-methyltetrahydrofolate--homocysteine methyltransferase